MNSSVSTILLLLAFYGFCEPTLTPADIEDVQNALHLAFGGRECCPCSKAVSDRIQLGYIDNNVGSPADHLDPEKVAFEAPGVAGGCACGTGAVDSLQSGPSDSIAEARDPRPVMRKPAGTQDNRTLLRPEVGLASSVLETIREATKEEYEDALKKERVMNAERKVGTTKNNLEESDPSIESMLKSFTKIMSSTDPVQQKRIISNIFPTEKARYVDSDVKETNQDAVEIPSEIEKISLKPEKISVNEIFNSLPKLRNDETVFRAKLLQEFFRNLQSKNKNKADNVYVSQTNGINKRGEENLKVSDAKNSVENEAEEIKSTVNTITDLPVINESSFVTDKSIIFKRTRDERRSIFPSNDDQQQAGINNENITNTKTVAAFQKQADLNNFDYDFNDNNYSLEDLRENSKENKITYLANRSTAKEDDEIESDEKEHLIINFDSDEEKQNIRTYSFSDYPETSNSNKKKIKAIKHQKNIEKEKIKNGNEEICQNKKDCIVFSNSAQTTKTNFDYNDDLSRFKSSSNNIQKKYNLLKKQTQSEVPSEENMYRGQVDESLNTMEDLLLSNNFPNGNIDLEDSEETRDVSSVEIVSNEKMEKKIFEKQIAKDLKVPKPNSSNNYSETSNDTLAKQVTEDDESMVTSASNTVSNVLAPPDYFLRNLRKQSATVPSVGNDLIIQPESFPQNLKGKVIKKPLVDFDDLLLNKLELPSAEELRSKINNALRLSSQWQPNKLQLPITKLPPPESSKPINSLGDPQERPVKSTNFDFFQLTPAIIRQSKEFQPNLKEILEKLHSYRLNVPVEKPIIKKPAVIKSNIKDLALQPEPNIKSKLLSTFTESSPKLIKNKKNKTTNNKIIKKDGKLKNPSSTADIPLYTQRVEVNPKTIKIPKLQSQFLHLHPLFDSNLVKARKAKNPVIENQEGDHITSNRKMKKIHSIVDNLLKSPIDALSQGKDKKPQIPIRALKLTALPPIPTSLRISPDKENYFKNLQPKSSTSNSDSSSKKTLTFHDMSKPLDILFNTARPTPLRERINDLKLRSTPDDHLKFKSFATKVFDMGTDRGNQEIKTILPHIRHNQLNPGRPVKLKQAQPTKKAQINGLENEKSLQRNKANDNNDNTQTTLYNHEKIVGILSDILSKLASIDKNLNYVNFQPHIFNSHASPLKRNIHNFDALARDSETDKSRKSDSLASVNVNGMTRPRRTDIKIHHDDLNPDPSSRVEIKTLPSQKFLSAFKQAEGINKKMSRFGDSDVMKDETFTAPDIITTSPMPIQLDSTLLAKLKEALAATTNKILKNYSPKFSSDGDMSQKPKRNIEVGEASSNKIMTSMRTDPSIEQNVAYKCNLMCTNE